MQSVFRLYIALLACCSGCTTLRQSTSQVPAPDSFESSFAIARAYEGQGKISRAMDVYGRLLADHPQDHQVHHRLGVISVRRNRPQEAISHFEQALGGAPDNQELLTDMGYTFYLLGRYQDAEGTLRQVLSKDPANERAVNNLGLVLAKQGQTAEAFSVFRKTGSPAEAHANLAYVYASTGQIELAERHYSRALDYDESLTQASEALLQLHGIQRDIDPGSHFSPGRDVVNAKKATPQENPESVEFASRWQSKNSSGAGITPTAFQFTDQLYDQSHQE